MEGWGGWGAEGWGDAWRPSWVCPPHSRFPLFMAVYKICYENHPVSEFICCLQNHPEHS